MPSLTRTRVRLAFTLVELLVVIGIIVLLLAVLLPVLGKVKAQAQQVKCQANLRGIGQALILYVDQYRYYPAAMAGAGTTHFGIWPPRLRTVMKADRGLFYCPAQDARFEWRRDAQAGAVRATEVHAKFGYEIGEPVLVASTAERCYFSYGYNARGTGAGPPGERDRGLGDQVWLGAPLTSELATHYGELRANRVRRPAEMIAVTDSNGDGSWDHGVQPHLDGGLPWIPGKIHNGGSNVLFCDGHVQWYLQKDITLPPASNRYDIMRMWNNHNKSDSLARR